MRLTFSNTLVLSTVLGLILPDLVLGETRPRRLDHDPRVAVVVFRENDVVRIDTALRHITSIEFETGENITAIMAGDTASFEIVRLKTGNVLSVKPVIANARTNLNVFTNRRRYAFDLRSGRRDRISGYRVLFRYPEVEAPIELVSARENRLAPTATARTDYEAAGVGDFRPTQVWDDGVNTYFRFAEGSRRPAFFKARSTGEESATNTVQVDGAVVQVIGLSDFWSLRAGGEVVCIRRKGRVALGGVAAKRFDGRQRTFGFRGGER